MLWAGLEPFGVRAADITSSRRGRALASVGSWSVWERGENEDADRSRMRTVCGQFVSVAMARSGTVETGTCSRTRLGRDRDCGRRLNADMDCARTRTIRVRG